MVTMYEDHIKFEVRKVIMELHNNGIEKSEMEKFFSPDIIDYVFKEIELKQKIDREIKRLKDRLDFTLTEDHVKLMKKFVVDWRDIEYGAPEIDPKRPYGNSDVSEDIIKITGKNLTESQCLDLHQETQFALQILVEYGKIDLGTYHRQKSYSRDWEKTKK